MADESPHVASGKKPRKDNVITPTIGGVPILKNMLQNQSVKWAIGIIVVVIIIVLIVWLYKSSIRAGGGNEDEPKELFDVTKKIANLNALYT